MKNKTGRYWNYIVKLVVNGLRLVNFYLVDLKIK